MSSETEVDLFSKPAGASGSAPRLANGTPPRGLTGGGWVRTTGWLQFGDHPVSSAHVVALAGLLWSLVVAVALLPAVPVASGVVVLVVPVLGWVSWTVFTTRVKPASIARNNGTVRAAGLVPGDTVRLHGSIGPVGRVTAVSHGEESLVDFHGGIRRSWGPEDAVHRVELLS